MTGNKRYNIATMSIIILQRYVLYIATAIVDLESRVLHKIFKGVQYLKSLVEKGWNVLLFDFSGSGHSEG